MIFKFFVFLLLSFPEGTKDGVKFTYFNPDAKSVYLVGDFNNWNTSATPMEKNAEGLWSVVIPLSPGKYQYKFFVDGRYEQDPTNPITEGPYGNSVIKVASDYRVLPPTMSNNTPMNSYVTFGGTAKGFLKADRDTTEHYRLFDVETDVRMSVKVNIKDEANLIAILHYNTSQGQDPTTHQIPFYFERAKLNFEKGNLRFVSFYNMFAYSSPDPVTLVGRVNEFGYPLGRDEQGVLTEITSRPFSKITGLYSNKISTGRDLGFLRVVKDFDNLYGGISFYISHGNNIEYQVVSPDSEKANDSTFLHFNTYEDRYAYSLEIGAKKSLRFQIVVGHDIKRANYYDVDGTKTQQSPIDKKWDMEKWYKFRTDYSNKQILAYMDVENHRFDSLFVPIYGKGYSNLKTGALLRKKHFNVQIVQHFLFAHKNSTKWDALFRDFDITRLPYIEYPLLGYGRYTTISANTNFNLFSTIRFELSLKTARYALNQPPRSDEALLKLIIPIKRARFYYDMRYYHLKSSYLNIDKDFFDHYMELSYLFSRNLKIKTGYGFYPYNLLDEYTGRREYLSSTGVNLTQLKNNFRGIGSTIKEGERNISNTKEVRIWLELSF